MTAQNVQLHYTKIDLVPRYFKSKFLRRLYERQMRDLFERLDSEDAETRKDAVAEMFRIEFARAIRETCFE
jgi:predicted proteasome-type protease